MTCTTLLIGATGPTGRAILTQFKAANLSLRSLARDPAKIVGVPDVVRGDVLDRDSLVRAMASVDTVICALGTPLVLRGPVTLLSEGTRNILGAMRSASAVRLICITGMGAGDSRGHGPFLYDRLLLPVLLGRIYVDKNRQEALVRDSSVDWLLLRPARLTNGPENDHCREIVEWGKERMTRVSRAAVAGFMVREVQTPRYHRQVVNLTY